MTCTAINAGGVSATVALVLTDESCAHHPKIVTQQYHDTDCSWSCSRLRKDFGHAQVSRRSLR
jgi:hypothetical protein